MAARGIASLRRILHSAVGSPAIGSGSGGWWGLTRGGSFCSAVEKGAENEESGSRVEAKASRWTALPPVPLESAVRALEDIESYNEGSESSHDKMKRLTALRWVAKCCPNVPHSLINKLFRLRQIRMQVPGEVSSTHGIEPSKDTRLVRVSAKDTLEEGAVLCIPAAVVQSLDIESPASNTPVITAQDVKWLRSLILHKDKEIIVINKPSGLAVQGGSEVVRSLDSMMQAALSYDYNEGPRLVHRLDKETSGAMVVGRTHQSTVFLQALLRDKTAKLSRTPEDEAGTMERCYWALVIGVPEAKEGRISAPLAKVVTDNGKLDKMRVVHESHPNAQEAITDYKVLGSSVLGCSWLELRPLTGRKHQIRVHLAEVLGMPVVGDYKYGWRAQRVWPPSDHTESTKSALLGLKASGHVWASRPSLHLHCRHLTLPDVAAAFQRQQQPRRRPPLHFVAPLPPHMVLSWNMRPLDGFPMI
ncbi:hypothetical protein M758_9G087700 [Ceratodon purpureus]|nr:hypothetical protein M758_9G087700 [Ceratodon purpureus]